jgi:hypothetical protein
MKLITFLFSVITTLAFSMGLYGQVEVELHWFKGNTHTHTLNSDGDTAPGEVAHWYRDHDYDFLVLSDHDYRTAVDQLNLEFARETEKRDYRPFILIPGEETSSDYRDEPAHRRYVIHINAIGTDYTVGQKTGNNPREVMQNAIDAIHEAGGFPHVNHPNFYYSITADDFYSVKNLRHFEIFNGHPRVHSSGGGEWPSTEEIWDAVLERGRIYYGVATDDAHNFQKWGPDVSNPGRGWVMVRASELTPKAIIDSLKNGNFYASTGVELIDVTALDRTLRLEIDQKGGSKDPEDYDNATRYRTYFIGKSGQVLKIDESLEPSYTLQSGDLYVRARVESSNGERAWTQPLFAHGKGRYE